MMIPVSSFAQKWKLRRYEALVSLCTAQYYGDIGGSKTENSLLGLKDISILSTRASFAFGARYKLTAKTAVKMNLIYGFISGTDNNSRYPLRGLSFYSTIFEPSFQLEYYPISESKTSSSPASFSHRGMVNSFGKLYPYVFVGAGGVFYNPVSTSDKFIIPKDIPGIAVTFPVGIGLKLGISSKLSVGFEYGRRFTTTDKIDGKWEHTAVGGKVIESKSKDLYDFGMFSAIYQIPTDRRGLPIFGKAKKYRR
jgi:opacity protein-like surface antigen